MAQISGSVHKDHRKRVKKRFREEGLDHFDQVHALELLLFYGIPQGDTNPLAHQLIDHFGSLAGVLDAPVEELERIPGVGEHVSTLLSLVRGMTRYYLVNRNGFVNILKLHTPCDGIIAIMHKHWSLCVQQVYSFALALFAWHFCAYAR